jgi:hypothetical protein
VLTGDRATFPQDNRKTKERTHGGPTTRWENEAGLRFDRIDSYESDLTLILVLQSRLYGTSSIVGSGALRLFILQGKALAPFSRKPHQPTGIMDAPDQDRDAWVQKSSATLLADFETSLKPFLWKNYGTSSKDIRRRVRVKETDRLIALVPPNPTLTPLLIFTPSANHHSSNLSRNYLNYSILT